MRQGRERSSSVVSGSRGFERREKAACHNGDPVYDDRGWNRKFLNDVCNLVETKKTTDIVDISNQSSKEGIRIVIELKRGADVET